MFFHLFAARYVTVWWKPNRYFHYWFYSGYPSPSLCPSLQGHSFTAFVCDLHFANFIPIPFMFLPLLLLLCAQGFWSLPWTEGGSWPHCSQPMQTQWEQAINASVILFAIHDCVRFAYIGGHLQLCYWWSHPTIFDWTRGVLCHPLTFWHFTPPHRFHNQLSLRKYCAPAWTRVVRFCLQRRCPIAGIHDWQP